MNKFFRTIEVLKYIYVEGNVDEILFAELIGLIRWKMMLQQRRDSGLGRGQLEQRLVQSVQPFPNGVINVGRITPPRNFGAPIK